VASRPLLLFGSVVLLTLAAVPARAEPSIADRATARALMDEADRDVERKDLAAALKAYQGADAIMHVPTTGIEVARTEEQLGMLLEAYEAALSVVRAPVRPGESVAFAASRTAASALVASLAGRIPSLEVRISGLAPGARGALAVDAEPVPAEAVLLPRRVNPGKHALVVSAPGYATTTRDVMVAERERATVEVRVEPVSVAVAPPATLPEVPAVATATPIAAAPPPSRHSMAATYTLFAVGGASLAAGAVTGVLSLTSLSGASCNGSHVCSASGAAGDLSTSKGLAWASDVTLGVGVVGVVAATVLYLTRPREAAAPAVARLHLTGGASQSGATVGIVGSF
jgi:hypothetical protein